MLEWVASHEGGYQELSRQLGGTPSGEALRLFGKQKEGAEQKDGVSQPRYVQQLLDFLKGANRPRTLAEEAAAALALIRQGAAALERLSARLERGSEGSQGVAKLPEWTTEEELADDVGFADQIDDARSTRRKQKSAPKKKGRGTA